MADMTDTMVDEMSEKCSSLMNEQPKIESAVKNLISVLLAENMTIASNDFERQEAMTPSAVIACARKIVKYINDYSLKDVVQWGVDHPQGSEETASDRIDSLANYKVAYFMWAKAKSKSGKLCKIFGFNLLLWSRMLDNMYVDIMETYGSDPKQAEPPRDILAEFIYCFLQSLPASSKPSEISNLPAVVTNNAPYRGLDQQYSALIWCDNFATELQKLQANRRLTFESRNDEYYDNQQRLAEQQHMQEEDRGDDAESTA
jgi:hypothetical protein